MKAYRKCGFIVRRSITSSSSLLKGSDRPPLPSLSPSEAGQVAYKARLERNQNISHESTSALDTVLSHAGLSSSAQNSNEPYSENVPLCPPLHLETTYTRPPSGDYGSVNEGGKGWIYNRMGNPTRKLLEDILTNLELSSSNCIGKGANINDEDYDCPQTITDKATTCAFSSGMAAVSSIILALSQQQQPLHIILPDDVYHGVPSQLKTIFVEQGVTYSAIDMTQIQCLQEEVGNIRRNFCNKMSKSKNNVENDDNTCNMENGNGNGNGNGIILIWMESPSNPLCKVTDIKNICQWVDKYRSEIDEDETIVTIVDSTWAPPYLTQPVRKNGYFLAITNMPQNSF